MKIRVNNYYQFISFAKMKSWYVPILLQQSSTNKNLTRIITRPLTGTTIWVKCVQIAYLATLSNIVLILFCDNNL